MSMITINVEGKSSGAAALSSRTDPSLTVVPVTVNRSIFRWNQVLSTSWFDRPSEH
jgi:hypothetical protein